MYTQADIREPVTDESIQEHRYWVAVEARVDKLIKGRRKAAPAELVEELHRGKDAHLVWRALSTGCVNKHESTGAPLITFAGLCYARGRLDILRAVHESGVPQWLKTMPRMERPVEQFKALNFPLVDDISPSGWLRALTTFQTWGTSENTHHVSLFRIAVEPIGKHTEGFLQFALEVDPQHPDIEGMRERNPEGYALLTQLQMRARIAASQDEPQPQAAPGSTRHRLRASI
jgi:hypothetical protein